MISSGKNVFTTIVPNHIAVAMKLREGVSPQELIESVIRDFVFHPLLPDTFTKMEEVVEKTLLKYNVRVKATVDPNPDAAHGIVVYLKSLSGDS